MDIRELSDQYSVSPQIDPSDLRTIADAGYRTVICNRPDGEVPPSHQATAIKSAAETAGLAFVELPVTHNGLTLDLVEAQREAVENSEGPTLAYCASGNRSSIVWALGQAGRMPTDEILMATGKAGYNLSHLQQQLQVLAERD